jgi:DNA-binding NtrC family response regulator
MSNLAPRLLIADDQPDVLSALRFLLKPHRYIIETASSPAAAMAALESTTFDLALVDMNYARDTTSGAEGLDLIGSIRDLDSTLGIIVMTAWSSIELAVEAMRRGARDFVQKPWENHRLLATLATQLELTRALRRGRLLEEENSRLQPAAASGLVGESPAMQQVQRLIARIAPSDANVLVTGEHGSGKGMVARAIHAASLRATHPLVTVNTGGLSENLFESEVFGHVKGAFTDARTDRVGRFELAGNGTIFPDEIANVPAAQQARLLRVLESGEFERVGSSVTRRVNARIISATNADLRAEVETGRFREDLLFRLNTVEIAIPPLRDRREDIPTLAGHFLRRTLERYRKRVDGFDEAALQMMMRHHWPGNVRELEHVVERAVLMAEESIVRPMDLGLRTVAPATAQRLEDLSLEEVEAHLIRKALARHEGNVSHAAAALGLSRSALYRRLQRYNI